MNRKKSGEGIFNKWNEKLRNTLKNSLPVRIMTFFGGLEERSDKGFFVTRVKKLGGAVGKRFDIGGRLVRPARIAFSREMEQSVLLHLLGRMIDRLLGAPLRAYGIFLLTFSFYTILLSAASNYLTGAGWLSAEMLVKGAVSMLCPLPMLFASKETSLAGGLLQSRICSYLLFDLLGLERQTFEKKRPSGNGILAGFLLGMMLSVLTLVMPVKSLLVAVFGLVFICISYVRPESATLLCCLCAPFVSGGAIRLMLTVAAIFFIVKLLRGKRNLKLGVYSSAMLVYGGLVFFCGIVRPAGVGFESAGDLLTILLAFFLPALLFYKKEWIVSASGVLCLGVTVAVLGGVLLFVAGFVPEEYHSFLPFIETLKESPLYSNTLFGIFAVLALPVFAVRVWTDSRVKSRISALLLLLLLTFAAVISKDLGVWLVFVLSLMLTLIFSKNISVFPLLAVTGGSVLIYVFLMPEWAKNAVADYCNGFSADFSVVLSSLTESASRFFAGIGMGSAPEGGNLYTGLLIEQGLAGVVLLMFVLVGVLCYATYAAYNTDGADRVSLMMTGGFSVALIGALILGAFTDLFAQQNLTFLVFFLAGTLWASAKALCEEGARSVRRTEIDRDYLFEPVIRREKKSLKRKQRNALKEDVASAARAVCTEEIEDSQMPKNEEMPQDGSRGEGEG